MIYSLEIEKQVLAAFIQKPKILFDDILLDTLEFWREKVKKKDFI